MNSAGHHDLWAVHEQKEREEEEGRKESVELSRTPGYMGGTRAKREDKKGRRGRKEREHGTQQDSRIYGLDTSGKREKTEGRRGRKERERNSWAENEQKERKDRRKKRK